MKNMLLKNKLKTLAFFICAFALAGLFALNTASASYAEDGLATEIELPSSYLEYRDLSAPRDVYYDEDVTAVIEGAEDDKTLVIYYQGLFKEIALSNASQIARIGGQLIYQQDSSFYAYSLADGTAKQLKDAEGSVITGSYFCLNESYFLVFSTNLVKIYRPTGTADELSFTNTGKTITANATANPITVNAKNDVFYFSDNRLYRQNLDNAEIRDEYGAYDTTTNSRLLADNNYLYISSANGVSRLRLSDKAREDVAKVSAEESALGDILSPVGMAFRKGNLLIADTACDKIVEYDPETASFTGWAIATTANADNRLTVSTPDVSLNGDTYAVLNGNGLTVTDGDVFTRYDLQKMNAAGAPTTVALGDRYAALIVNSKLAFIDLEADEESAEIIYYAGDGAAFTPIDIAYSCGSFYMTTYAYPYTTFYKIEESDLNTSVKALQIENLIETFTVDIDGNIYTLIDRTVSKYTEKSLISGVTFTEKPLKIGVDLNGNVYALLSGNTLEYYRGDEKKTAKLNVSPNLPAEAEATAMAMSFDNGKIYFLFNGYGFILSTAEAENDNINDIPVPADFRLTDTTAKPLAEFKLNTLKENKNVYVMDYAEGKFTFKEMRKSDGREYVYAGESEGFAILLGDEIILVKTADREEKIPSTESDVRKGYAATDVYMYYYPVLTKSGEYKLSEVQRLKTDQEIEIGGKVSVNGKEFYYVSANGAEGYVPADFVTEKLAQAYDRETFAYKTVNAGGKKTVTVYADPAMTEKADTLDAAIKVKAHPTANAEVYYIEYDVNGETAGGYVYARDFKTEGKHAVRNAVIISLVALSVAVTSLYFVNRRRIKH